LKTANGGWPRPEEVIGSAKVDINEDAHIKQYKAEYMVDGEVILVGWVL